jgi:hypothetical protein
MRKVLLSVLLGLMLSSNLAWACGPGCVRVDYYQKENP